MITKAQWESTVGSVCTALALLAVLVACSGKGSDGVGPTAPLEGVDISGHWAGTTTIESVSGCGCVGMEFTSGNRDRHSEWEISQRGASIEGTFVDDHGPGWCDFEGAVDVNEFSAASTGCEQEQLQWECENGEARDLVLRSIDWQGQVHLDSSNIRGTGVTTWDCFDSLSGQAAGTLTLQSALWLWRGGAENHPSQPGTVEP